MTKQKTLNPTRGSTAQSPLEEANPERWRLSPRVKELIPTNAGSAAWTWLVWPKSQWLIDWCLFVCLKVSLTLVLGSVTALTGGSCRPLPLGGKRSASSSSLVTWCSANLVPTPIHPHPLFSFSSYLVLLCLHVCVPVHVEARSRGWRSLVVLHLNFRDRAFHWTLSSLTCLDYPVSKSPRSSPVVTSSVVGLQTCNFFMPAFWFVY